MRQPWASAMFMPHAPKTVENRTWKTNYRGPLAIVAGLQQDRTPEADAAWALLNLSAPPTGLILGVVQLVDIHEQFTERCDCVLERDGGWARTNLLSAPRPMQHWILDDPRPMPEGRTFPYTGFLGIGSLGNNISRALKEALS